MTQSFFPLLGSLAFFLSTVPSWGADWPQFLGPDRNGQSAETGLIDKLPSKAPVVWSIPSGAGFSGPVVVGKRVLVFEQADGKAILRCLDADTGKTVWQDDYPCRFIGGLAGGGAGPRATPVVVEGMIYTIGPESTLRCNKLEDGSVIWSRPLSKEYTIPEGFFGASSTPLVVGNRLILNVGGEKAGIVAFDRLTGKTLWQTTDEEASYASPVAGTIAGKPLAFVFARSGLHGLDPANGKDRFFFRWRARISASVNAATPILAGDSVFITSSYNTGAAMLKVTGDGYETQWSGQDIMSSQYNTPVFFDGCLVGIDGRADAGLADLVCVDAKTGEKKWTKEGYGCASIIVVDGKLLLFSDAGNLEMAHASTKEFVSLGKARIFSDGDCRAHPALADGQLYLRGSDSVVRVNLSARQEK